MRRQQASMIVVSLFGLVTGSAKPAYAQVPLDEALVFDSIEDKDKLDEALVRQRLGLLDADGKPQTDGSGNLVPSCRQTGRRKGLT